MQEFIHKLLFFFFSGDCLFGKSHGSLLSSYMTLRVKLLQEAKTEKRFRNLTGERKRAGTMPTEKQKKRKTQDATFFLE